MIISFFEEFPKKENLKKIKMVDWETKLYIGAKSISEFKKISSKIKNRNVKEKVYWPILERKEGYWISPWTEKEALKRVSEEIKKSHLPVMLDLELPTTRNPLLYLTQSQNFFNNWKAIEGMIKKKSNVYLAEYYPDGMVQEKILQAIGLHFDPRRYGNRVVKMVYHSTTKFREGFIKKELERGKKRYGDKFIVAYGTIARGVNGDEPLLKEKQLKKDLEIAKNAGVKEVVIYRLGGLNKSYSGILKEFAN